MKKLKVILLTIIALVILAGGSFAGYKLYNKYSEGTTRADLFHYFKLASTEEGAIMMNGTILDADCRVVDGICYLDIDTVQTYLHNRFYYTELSREIRYTDAATVVTAALDQGIWSSTTGGETEQFEEPYVIAMNIGETCYIALDFIEKYVPVTHEIYREPDRVVIDSMESCREMASVKRDTYVRWRAGVKSEILTEVKKGDQVMMLDAPEEKGWYKVATKDGFVGYIRSSKLGARATITNTSTHSYVEPEFVSTQLEEKVRLGFHGVYNMTANKGLEDALETAYNINVISPTWFSLSDNAGNFTSIASSNYVTLAHERGIQVWGLVEDITNDVDTYEILANSDNRTHLINGLVSAANQFDLDGLNIDFEGIRGKDGPHFVQFIRELSIRCREEGLILSVDNYPPNQGNVYYDYAEQGVFADYVILMGYDEHWKGCGDPGSTASQPFVEQSMDNLLSMVDSSKVINALPFYTRLWKTTSEGTTDSAIVMTAVDDVVSKYGMTVDYDEATGLSYARSEKDGAVYQMWIEDYASMEKKLIAVQDRGLAGVAAWRLGYEDQEIWELIGAYIQ